MKIFRYDKKEREEVLRERNAFLREFTSKPLGLAVVLVCDFLFNVIFWMIFPKTSHIASAFTRIETEEEEKMTKWEKFVCDFKFKFIGFIVTLIIIHYFLR